MTTDNRIVAGDADTHTSDLASELIMVPVRPGTVA